MRPIQVLGLITDGGIGRWSSKRQGNEVFRIGITINVGLRYFLLKSRLSTFHPELA